MAMPSSGSPGGRGGYQDHPMMGQGGYGPPPQGTFGPGGFSGAPGPQSTNQHGSYGQQGGFGSYGPSGGMQGQGAPGYSYDQNFGGANSLKAIGMSSGNHMNDVFFAAACCIILASGIGGTCLFFTLEPVDFIQMTYLMMFGCIMAVLDTPFLKTLSAVVDARMYIGKYIQFVTRVTGKGISFIFLGSAAFMTMWDNLQGGFLLFLSVVLCAFPTLVGLCSVVIGLLKSSKLDKARRQLQLVIDQRYDHFAQTYRGPQGGLTMSEFNGMTMENGGFKFETLDLKLIFNALVTNPAWRNSGQQAAGGYANLNDEMKIPKQDLMEWCRSGWVFL